MPPQISQSRLASTSAAFAAGGGTITVRLEIGYFDSDADLATLGIKVADGAPIYPPVGTSGTGPSGTVAHDIDIATSTSGPVPIEAWLVDRAGQSSNHVTETFTVLGGVNLSRLTLSTGELDPSFAPDVHDYVTTASFLESSVTVTPTLADPRATVRVNGITVDSGAVSSPIALPVGETQVTLSIEAEPGAGRASYTLRVRRLSASNAWIVADDRVVLVRPTGDELASVASPFGRVLRLVAAESAGVDPTDGSLWITDTNNDRLLKFGPGGEPVLEKSFLSPVAVWVDPRDSTAWISAGLKTRDVIKLSAAGDEMIRVSGFSSLVHSVARDDVRGTLWVADRGANEVVRLLGTDSELDGYDASAAAGPHHIRINGFYQPMSVSVNPREDGQGLGNVWVANRYPGQAVKLTSEGAELFRATPSVGYELRRIAVNVLDGSAWAMSEPTVNAITNFSALGVWNRSIERDARAFLLEAFSLDPEHEIIWLATGAQAAAFTFDGAPVVTIQLPDICDPPPRPLICRPNVVREVAVQMR